MTIIWSDPPSAAPGGIVPIWVEMLAPCMDRPGTWGMVRDYVRREQARRAVQDLRRSTRGRGKVRIPPGEWEFSHGPIPDSTLFGVWAKWLGPGDE